MSIKSLFEDIADAIREKSGSSDTYTPAEMPGAIANIPAGGGDDIIEEWNFKESLTGKKGAVATLTGSHIERTSNGIHIDGWTSCVNIPITAYINRRFILKLGNFSFGGNLSSNTGVIMIGSDSTGFLRRSTGYMAVYLGGSWTNSQIYLSTKAEFDEYLTNSEITLEVLNNRFTIYINGVQIVSAVWTSPPMTTMYLTIGDKRASSSGGQFYDVYIESLKIEPIMNI